MDLLSWGCNCTKCRLPKEELLKKAREEWQTGERRNISFKTYHYDDEWGTEVSINDCILSIDGENVESVAQGILEFLGIKDYEIYSDYDADNDNE
jgi:hypothetical protein